MIPDFIYRMRALLFLQAISLLITCPARADVLLSEDFESYTVGTWPSPAWVQDANAINDPSNNQIVNSPGGRSGKSLKLLGQVGGCWAALAYRPFTPPSSFVLECDVYNGSEALSGCHPFRGCIALRQGTSWVTYGRTFVEFLANGDIRCHGAILGQYQVSRWYHVKVGYNRNGTQLSLTYWLDGQYLGKVDTTIADTTKEDSIDHLDLTAQEGSVWFDNIRVTAGHDTSAPGWLYPRRDRAGLACQPAGSSVPTGTNLVQQFTIAGVESHVLTGDVDGDGAMEVVTVSGSTMNLYDGNGVLKRTVMLPRASYPTMLEDVDGDGVLDIGLGGNGTGFASYIYKGDGTLLKTLAGQHAGGSDVSMQPIGFANGKVLMGYDAGYAVTPRGMAAFDYATGTETWYYQVGPASGWFSVADMDGDGKLEITKAAATVHNGASGNGTTDSDLYLIVVDETGSNRLTQMYPSPTEGSARHVFADLTGDGKPEIVAFEEHDPIYYPGVSQIHVYGAGGIPNTLHTFDGPNNTGWAFAVGDLDGDGVPEVVATAIGTQTTYVLDANLNELRENAVSGNVQLLCDLNGDGKKEIVLLSDTGTLRVLDKDLNEIATAQAGTQGGEVIASDIDSDGIVELLCRTDQLHVFKFSPIPSDADGDGVPDAIDQCPNTPLGAIVNAHGCSIAQLVPCDGPASGGKWKSHGQYVRAVVATATDFLKAKLITRKQWVEFVTRAAWSKCGWNRRCDHDWDGDWHRNWDCDRDRDWGRGRNWDRD